MTLSPKQLIAQFNLIAHPEGGYYKEMYRSAEIITQDALPARFVGDRSFSTAIYFLLEKGDFSTFHRIKSDECWHFYAGNTLHIYVLHSNGELEIISLGNDLDKGERFQYVVPAGCWFASAPAEEVSFSFVGCTVAPGFNFADFEMAKAGELVKSYPQHTAIIKRLSR
jgi:predicted cupin superfamily sugar epimerase